MTQPATDTPTEERMKPRHLRRTLYWLALDYLHIAENMPMPATGRGQRTSNTKEYGHPAEWASVKAAEIADDLTSWHDFLAEERAERQPRRKRMGRNDDGDDIWTWADNQKSRVVAAWKYLEPRCEQLVDLVPKEALEELPSLHNSIRRALGQHAPKYTLPVPCPNDECGLRTLIRVQGIGQDFITCDSCGYTIKEVHYPFMIRMILDTLIGSAR
ncbi:hypothetical protein [Mycolicibacterium llatzerense]|uniref:hypothetical protein n=1 Tax=Mycolicibacterium llatzerense TaxID=280871 RepID=UPI0021B65699|nr:hypothetical protein [Mycolicibacterium llatzerense]MCT7361213.1 hypothetical protein [Mycolicibacterium llatzerense]